jgi:hypothetical protein
MRWRVRYLLSGVWIDGPVLPEGAALWYVRSLRCVQAFVLEAVGRS